MQLQICLQQHIRTCIHLLTDAENDLYMLHCEHLSSPATTEKQESCAIAKMTAQCALYMGAVKIFGTP